VDARPKLTARQQQIFDLVCQSIEETGAPPTRAEIAATLGFKSANAAEEHLQALARKGAIELVGGTSRGIRIPPSALQSLNRARDSRKSAFDDRPFDMPAPSLAHMTLPLIGRVAAGAPILAQEHIEQQYSVEPGLFTKKPDYLLRVRGMSMRDIGIVDGDLLAVQKCSEAKNGQIVVARLGDEVTVKRFRKERNTITLSPENPEFEAIHIGPESEPFAIEGLAVGLIRPTFLS